jgi:hypothetical protein
LLVAESTFIQQLCSSWLVTDAFQGWSAIVMHAIIVFNQHVYLFCDAHDEINELYFAIDSF